MADHGTREKDGFDVRPMGVLGSIYGGPVMVQQVYDAFFESFEDKRIYPEASVSGPSYNPSFILFAYDFRKDLRTTANHLAETIIAAAKRSGVEKINLIGHSMGALLCFICLAHHPKLKEQIGRIILIGGPLNGTPDAQVSLYRQVGWGKKIMMAAGKATTVMTTWPGFHQLLAWDYYEQLNEGGYVFLKSDSRVAALSLTAGYVFVSGQLLDPVLFQQSYTLRREAHEKFSAGPFPPLTRIVEGSNPTHDGMFLPVGKDKPYRLISLRYRDRALAASPNGETLISTHCNDDAAICWELDLLPHQDGFTLLHASLNKAVSAEQRDSYLALTAINSSNPTQVWRINEKGQIENGHGLIIAVLNDKAPQVMAISPDSQTGTEAWFCIDYANTQTKVIPSVSDAGDGTVTRIGAYPIKGLKEPIERVTLADVDHLDLVAAPKSVEAIKRLLLPSRRTFNVTTTENLRFGPAGGTGYASNGWGSGHTYDVFPPQSGVKLKRLIFKSSGVVNGIAAIEYDNGSIFGPYGGQDGEDKTLALTSEEYITAIHGHISTAGSAGWLVVQQLVISTSFGREFAVGNQNSSGLPFKIEAPSGYLINGFWGHDGAWLDSIGVYVSALPLAPATWIKSLKQGPVGTVMDPLFWIHPDEPGSPPVEKGRLVAVRIFHGENEVKGFRCTFNVVNATSSYEKSTERGSNFKEIELKDFDDYITSVRGLVGWRWGFFESFPLVIQLEIHTRAGGIITAGSSTPSFGVPAPFQFDAPDGFKINGFWGRLTDGGWGLTAFGVWITPVSTGAIF